MNTGIKELQSVLEELDELKLPHMAAELVTLYKHPDFLNTGRLELISAIIHAEYTVTTDNRYTSRLKKARLRGKNLSNEYSFAEILLNDDTRKVFISGMAERSYYKDVNRKRY